MSYGRKRADEIFNGRGLLPKDDYDKRLVAEMWCTRRMLWIICLLLWPAVAIVSDDGITVLSSIVFIAASVASVAVLMVEIERAQPANDDQWRKVEERLSHH